MKKMLVIFLQILYLGASWPSLKLFASHKSLPTTAVHVSYSRHDAIYSRFAFLKSRTPSGTIVQ
jgi:hypothetical protein